MKQWIIDNVDISTVRRCFKCGVAISAGTGVYISAVDGKIYPYTTTTKDAYVGIAEDSGMPNKFIDVVTHGYLKVPGSGWAAGLVYYVNNGGGLTAGAGDTAAAVGYAEDAIIVYTGKGSDAVIVLGTGNLSSVRKCSNNISTGACSTTLGYCNTSSGLLSSTLGGTINTSSGIYSFIGNGSNNAATCTYSSVLNGCLNSAPTQNATILNGYCNSTNTEEYQFVANGFCNSAGLRYATILNGLCNTISGRYNTIGNGDCNTITTAIRSFIGSGNANAINIAGFTGHAFIGSGIANCVTARRSNIVGGRANIVSNSAASIVGGCLNTASGYYSFLGGGYCNVAAGYSSVVGGGLYNTVHGPQSFLGGGNYNKVCTGSYSSVVGGVGNNTSGGTWNGAAFTAAPTVSNMGCYSFIGGGFQNRAACDYSNVLGGCLNVVCNTQSSILGGSCNTVTGPKSVIVSGLLNANNSIYGFIGSGYCNTTSNYYSAIISGLFNTASHYASTVLGGAINTASAPYAVIVNGSNNIVSGGRSIVGAGSNNVVVTGYSGIFTGQSNCVSSLGCFGAILGGFSNRVTSCFSGAFGCGLVASCAYTFYTNNHCACGNLAASTLTPGSAVCVTAGGTLTNYVPVGGGITLYYGAFSSSVTQTATNPNQEYLMTLNTTTLSNGVTISGSQITMANAGVYNIQFSAQIKHTSGGSASIDIWFKKNGTNIGDTNTKVVASNNTEEVAAWNIVESFTAGQYVELAWNSNVGGVQLLAAPAQTGPVRPAVPSVIVTVTRVG